MGRLGKMLPLFNIFDWADGSKYTIDDDNVVLPPDLAESDKATDAEAEEHFQTSTSKGESGKEKYKVEEKQLNTEPQRTSTDRKEVKEIEGR